MYTEEIDFLSERNVNDRVGQGGFFDFVPDYTTKSASTLFPIIVNGIARNMKEERIINITENDIEFLLQTTNNFEVKKEYFNPTAYILGYFIVDTKDKISRISTTKFKTVKQKVLPTLPDKPISDTDVIRYARFWMKLYKST